MTIPKFLQNKWVKIVAISLAVVTVLGASAGLVSLLTKKHLVPGEIANDPNISIIPEYGLRASDYAALYVQDGLKGCYMAYSLETISATEEEKEADKYSWANHVAGGEAATLYGASYWQGMGGGIGYKMTIDQWRTDADKVGLILPYDPEKMVDDGGIHMEAVMAYDGLTNKDGTRYFSNNYTRSETKSAFRIGLLSSLAFVAESDGANESFVTRWYLTKRGYGDDYYSYLNTGSPPFIRIAKDREYDYMPTRLDGSITSFSYASFFNEAQDSYHIRMRYGVAPYERFEMHDESVSADNYNKVRADTLTNQADRFSLFNGYPGRLYSIRVYEGKELTEAERTRNYFVDLMAFYRINVKDVLLLSSAEKVTFLEQCGNRANTRGIKMDYSNFDAVRSELFEIIDRYMP